MNSISGVVALHATQAASTESGLATAVAGLLTEANTAFLDAMQVMFLIALGVLAVGMLLGAPRPSGRHNPATQTDTVSSNGSSPTGAAR